MRPRPRLFLAAWLGLAVLACGTPGGAGGGSGPLASATAHAPREAPFDVEHYALDLRLEPATRSIHGTAHVRLWAREFALRAVTLDLEGLTVGGVSDLEGGKLDFVHSDGALTIQLGRELAPGDFVELVIAYGGAPAKGLWFSAEREGQPTQVFTQGECQDARWWFPCFDEPHDRATSEVRVDLPAGWRSTAAGVRIERSEQAGGRVIEHWRMAVPHPTYLVTLVAGDLAEAVDVWQEVPLVYLSAPQYDGVLSEAFAETPEVLEVFSELTGRHYPYPKYSQACVENFPFGGMENISATTMTDTMLRDERGYRDYDPAGLIAHEAAHQWFGDLLTCADWSHIWLNEGFATYFTLLYFEASRDLDEFRVGVRDMQTAYTSADVGLARRPTVWNVYKDPMDLFFGGQTYPGGGSRLHLLRFWVGDEAFFRGIRAYVAAHSGRSVTTRDFQDAMEGASGRDLDVFFQQWFEQRGYPEFAVQWSWDERAGQVVVQVEQTQAYADGTPAAFQLPVELEVREASGSAHHRVDLKRRKETLRLPAATRPLWVRFDDHSWIPKRIEEKQSVGAWLLIAAEAGDPNGRRDALDVLGRVQAESTDAAERSAALKVCVARLSVDGVEAVRAAAARALAGSIARGEAQARTALLVAAAEDPKAAVRVAALGSLGAAGADAELAAFGQAQFERGFSWACMTAAADLVRRTSTDSDDAFAWIAQHLDRASPHHVLRAGLLTSLAAFGTRNAAELLHSFALDPAAGSQAREVAVRLLPRLAPQDSAVLEDLIELLSTRDYRLRGATIEALGQLEDNRASEALEAAWRVETDVRHRRAIERALAAAAARR